MELLIKLPTWMLAGGMVLTVVFVIAYIVLSIVVGRYFYKEYKRGEEYHDNHAKKMAEMRKEFEERHKENKRKMNRFR